MYDGGPALDQRSYVLSELARRHPVDAREQRSLERFRELFEGLSDPFSEESDPVHVTASGIVVGERGVVLLKHRVLGIWLQPGGHIDPGETPWDAAIRESREETGLQLSMSDRSGRLAGFPAVVHVDVHPGPRGHTHLDLRYLVGGDDADPAPPEWESQEVSWFGWDEAIEIADPGLRGALVSLRR